MSQSNVARQLPFAPQSSEEVPTRPNTVDQNSGSGCSRIRSWTFRVRAGLSGSVTLGSSKGLAQYSFQASAKSVALSPLSSAPSGTSVNTSPLGALDFRSEES